MGPKISPPGSAGSGSIEPVLVPPVVYGKGGCWGTPYRSPPPPSFPRPAPRPSQLLPPATSLPASPPVQNPHSLSGHHPQAARPPRPIRTSYPHRLTLSAPPQHLQSTSSTPTQAPTPTLPPRPIRTSSPLFRGPRSTPLAARPAPPRPGPWRRSDLRRCGWRAGPVGEAH